MSVPADPPPASKGAQENSGNDTKFWLTLAIILGSQLFLFVLDAVFQYKFGVFTVFDD